MRPSCFLSGNAFHLTPILGETAAKIKLYLLGTSTALHESVSALNHPTLHPSIWSYLISPCLLPVSYYWDIIHILSKSLFKVYNSLDFSKFTKLEDHSHDLLPDHTKLIPTHHSQQPSNLKSLLRRPEAKGTLGPRNRHPIWFCIWGWLRKVGVVVVRWPEVINPRWWIGFLPEDWVASSLPSCFLVWPPSHTPASLPQSRPPCLTQWAPFC